MFQKIKIIFDFLSLLLMRSTQILATCIILLLSTPLIAQVGFSDAGSRSNSMGNASATLTDVYSAQNNQAALAYLEHLSVGFSTQNYFMVDGGISSHYGAFALPLKNAGSFGLSVNYKGDATFNQSKIGLGYGRKLTDELAVGLQLDYVGTSTSEVGSGAAFTFDIGLLYKPAKTISIGAKIFNPIRAKTGLESEQELPSLINLGIGYHPSEKILICAEAEQEMDETLRGKFGLEYHIIDQLFLRGGYITYPSMFSCGIGIQIKQFKLDLSSQFHQQLGPTPGLGISYDF